MMFTVNIVIENRRVNLMAFSLYKPNKVGGPNSIPSSSLDFLIGQLQRTENQ